MRVDYIDHHGDDLMVVNAARVSMDKESWWGSYEGQTDGGSPIQATAKLKEEDVKLIKYLSSHNHHSPFNHAFITFRVKAPIFVARQLVKHKFMPWNEVSRRYVDSDPEFYIPTEWRKRADNIKQGSSDDVVEQVEVDGSNIMPEHLTRLDTDWSFKTYKALLKGGVCPEQARMVLPQSMYTEWYWSGTLGAFLDMLKLRLDSHSQKETREVAEMIAFEVKRLFPVSYEAMLGEIK